MGVDDSGGMQTLLVGIDGACTSVVRPLIDDGRVPFLATLVQDGTTAPLESGIPPWTPSAWPSLYTGTNPGKHGVYGFLAFDGYDWTVVDSTHVRTQPLWHLLDQMGLTSVVVNVPVTHPPREFDGACIPGYTAPEDPQCHPRGLLDEIAPEVGEYRVYPRSADDPPPVDAFEEVVELRGRVFRHLADTHDPAFGFLQFQATDTICHERPGDVDALGAVYETVDEQVRLTVESCDPNTIVVASDHGIGPLEGSEFRANEFLRDRGFLTTTTGGTGMPSWAAIRDAQLKRGDEGDTGRSVAATVGGVLGTLGFASRRIGSFLDRVGLKDAVARVVPRALVRGATEQVDFRESDAYVRSRIECGVRINLVGREPDGTVPQAEYESLRNSLIEELSNLEAPDGEPVFETVERRENVFEGPELDAAPDVVTVPRSFEHLLTTRLRGEWFGEPIEPWNHKRDGILTLYGDGIGSAQLEDPHIYDVAPTVMATLGVARDEQMDGTVLGPVEPVGERTYSKPVPPERTTDLDSDVASRLERLGYTER